MPTLFATTCKRPSSSTFCDYRLASACVPTKGVAADGPVPKEPPRRAGSRDFSIMLA